MALALEIQKAGWKGAYVKEYMAVGEVHTTACTVLSFILPSRSLRAACATCLEEFFTSVSPELAIQACFGAVDVASLHPVQVLSAGCSGVQLNTQSRGLSITALHDLDSFVGDVRL